MKTGMKVAVCAAVCGTLSAGAVLAQRGAGRPAPRGPAAVRAALARTLELDETQQANIRAILESNRELLAQARMVGGQARMEIGKLILQGADEETLRGAWRRQAVELEEVLVAVAGVVDEVRQELTPEQVERLGNVQDFIMDMRASKLDMLQ